MNALDQLSCIYHPRFHTPVKCLYSTDHQNLESHHVTNQFCLSISGPIRQDSLWFLSQVDAALLHIIPLKNPKIDAPFEVVEQVVKALFSMRRKFIRSSLK